MEHYAVGYDSFAGPSLTIQPEELDRLDASHIEPDSPQVSIDAARYRNLENSINGTLKGYSEWSTKRSAPPKEYSEWPEKRNGYTNDYGGQPFTPPSSQPFSAEKPPSFIRTTTKTPGMGTDEMQRALEQRVDMVRREEGERVRRLDGEYRQQLSKLQKDLDEMLYQHQQVIKLKNEVENGLQMELDVAKKDLRRERDQRESEREKLQRNIRDLKERIRDLERRPSGRTRTVSFADGDDRCDYQRRLVELQRENDAKISNLVRHFEKEKSAAIEILKTKIKAEISLLIPRIKEQCQRAYVGKIQDLRDSLSSQYRNQYEETVRRLKEEHVLERRVWQRQTRDQLEYCKSEIIQKLRAKYELRILDVQNECERRILDRMRRYDSDESFS